MANNGENFKEQLGRNQTGDAVDSKRSSSKQLTHSNS